MDIQVQPGRYVVAVSGGVDSMALLSMLSVLPGLKLTVAHYDHGIREDSAEDRRLVATEAQKYGLPFVYAEGSLGSDTSEATARNARYAFLRKVQQATNARGIITAHHQDDLLETVIMNLIRGTGRKGLSPLVNVHDLHRPLLHLSKQDLWLHALDNQLIWREDSTNQDLRYMRNYLRHKVMPKMSPADRQKLVQLTRRQAEINHQMDTLLANYMHIQDQREVLKRQWFLDLSHKVAQEVMAHWLRTHSINDFDKRGIDRLVVGAKVTKPGKTLDIVKGNQLIITPNYLLLKKSNR
ncbi:MAG: hypothetical protein JWO41_244 [Candidatus Saccharibacteria bacterium]|nr:hypothetical protein [Candidatus Saccharibacteria bacterium]